MIEHEQHLVNERWQNLMPLGYPRYDVSSCGRVRSWFTEEPKILKKQSAGGSEHDKYHVVRLHNKDGYKMMYVHRLVLMAFVSMPPEHKPYTNHKDGNKKNNSLANLEWVSPKENVAHAYRNGLMTKEALYGNTRARKLSDEEAREVFDRAVSGELRDEIAEDYDITPATVTSIKAGRTYADVTDFDPTDKLSQPMQGARWSGHRAKMYYEMIHDYEIPAAQLARTVGVSNQTMYALKHGKTYSWATGHNN